MAIVTNQQIPTDHVEETLDPPIEELDQYKRSLTEGAPIDNAPAGVERVNFTHKGSHPASASSATPGATPAQRTWRDKFNECIACWKGLPASQEALPPCTGDAHRGHKPDIPWYPRSRGTTYHDWMKDCLAFKKANPNLPYTKCRDQTACTNLRPLSLVVATNHIKCGESISVQFGEDEEGCPPYIWSVENGGDLPGGAEGTPTGNTYNAPDTNPDCSWTPTVSVVDACGQTASVSFTVNCYDDSDPAFIHYYHVDGGTWGSWCGSVPGCDFIDGKTVQIYYNVTDCNGEVLSTANFLGGLAACRTDLSLADMVSEANAGGLCICMVGGTACDAPKCSCAYAPPLVSGPFASGWRPWPQSGETQDIRTEAMILQGCCPPES